uniref:Uncharacterized protein n=1 Tax=Rhizophora mucronata TaxID=61149 RepID=A0A2P2R3T0_RHIMU
MLSPSLISLRLIY